MRAMPSASDPIIAPDANALPDTTGILSRNANASNVKPTTIVLGTELARTGVA